MTVDVTNPAVRSLRIRMLTGDVPIRSRETANEAYQLYLQGRDPEARDLLAQSILGLAYAWASPYRNRGVSDEELNATAFLGLAYALDGAEPNRTLVEFLGYAKSTVTGRIKHFLRDSNPTLKLERSMKELLQDIRRSRRELSEPTPADIAAYLKLPVETIEEALLAELATQSHSLDYVVETTGDMYLAESDSYDQMLDWLDLTRAIDTLPEHLRQVVMLTIVGRTQAQISQEQGVTPNTICRYMKQAVQALRLALAP